MAISTIKRGHIEASVDSLGAHLTSLKLDGREYLWQGDPAWWSGQAPVLFPIVGCLRGDAAVSAEGPVSLKRHGFARLLEHELLDEGRGHVTYELNSTDETRALYPYDFKLNMTYTVANDALEQRFCVTNTGAAPLPFTLGGHPAFNVPVAGADEEFGDYELRFCCKWTYASPMMDLEHGLWDFSRRLSLLDNARSMMLDHALFDRVNTLCFEDVPQRSAAIVGTKSGHGVAVDFDGFDYLGVWSAEGEAPFCCLEPWTGVATAADESDVFEEKRGTVVLAPGDVYERAFTIRPF